MAKITPFEMRQLIAQYAQRESACKALHHPQDGYVPSVVRESLDRIDPENPTDQACMQVRAVKQCLGEKGVPFEETFLTLHQIFYLLSRGYTYEMAKKKARLVGETTPRANSFWKEYVHPAHREILKVA